MKVKEKDRTNSPGIIICKVICFAVVFALVFYAVQGLFVRKNLVEAGSTNAQTSYWNEYRNLESNTVDAIFVGSSIAYCNIDPMYMYGKSGYATCDVASASMHMDGAYLAIKEALKTQSPKVIFLEASAFRYQGDCDESKYHTLTDNLSTSLEVAATAMGNNWDEDKKYPLDFLFPLFRYHDRWDNLDDADWDIFFNGVNLTTQRGHAFTFTSYEQNLDFYAEDTDWKRYDRTYEYLDKIVKLCNENNIKLVLFKTPAKRWHITYSRAAQEYADANGLEFIDYTYAIEDMGIDTKTDFRDDVGHLNQYGAEKFCDYLLKNTLPSLGLVDHRGEYTQWDEDYQSYLTAKDTAEKAAKKKAEEAAAKAAKKKSAESSEEESGAE